MGKDDTNNKYGTTNHGEIRFPQMKPESNYQFAYGETKWRGRSFGLTELFNPNNPDGAGPRDFAHFITPYDSGHSSPDNNVYAMTTVMHNDSHMLGATSLTQTLYVGVSEKTGEITRVGSGSFNLEAANPIGALLGGDTFYYSADAYNFMDGRSDQGAWMPETSDQEVAFYVERSTNSQYLRNLARKYGVGQTMDERADGAILVRLKLDPNDSERNPRAIFGELMSDHFEGYMRQDTAEANAVLDNFPAGFLEEFGLLRTDDGLVNAFLSENNARRIAPDGSVQQVQITLSPNNIMP